MSLDLTALRCLVAVADHRSLRQAAAYLGMSEPPLSRRMQRLEDELGCRILERSYRGVQLTQAGQELAARGRAILRQVDEAADETRLAADGLAGRIAIGFSDDFLHGPLPLLLSRFIRAHPQVKLEVGLGHTWSIARDVQTEALTLGFVLLPLPPEVTSLAIRSLGPVSVSAVMAKDHPLSGRKSLRLIDLAGETILMAPHAPSAFYVQLLGAFRRANFMPRMISSLHPTELHVELAMHGAGIAFATPDSANLAGKEVAAIPIDKSECMIERVLIWNPASARRVPDAFLELVAETFPS
jgi:DNA-binding transcriptional LysR family regulator